MSRFVFKLPDIGEGIVEAEIVQWHVRPGEVVEEDQLLVEVMTDKATVEIESPVAGTVAGISGAPGDMVAIGAELISFDVSGDVPEEAPAPEPVVEEKPVPEHLPEPEPEPEPEPTPAPPPPRTTPQRATAGRPAGEKPLAAPSVRRHAREARVNLSYVPATGPAGRITHDDLEAFIQGGGGPASAGAGQPARREGGEQIKVIGLRRRIAEKMSLSASRIPHFTYVEEVDVTELEALRRHINATRGDERPNLTLLPFLVRAVVASVTAFPQANATFDDEAGVVTRHHPVHVGIATQTGNGLMVPVVRHAEAMDLWQTATEIRRVAEAARDGSATSAELSGSTITITSLGASGGIVTTPVINHPEVAILGVNRMVERPVVHGGQIATRRMMNLSSSFDHRVVDGYDAAAFVQNIRGLLEHPATLFME
jgi:2-oxoisovalerate dehydrogenase E2 component (dihydrolipoyl transacylase)